MSGLVTGDAVVLGLRPARLPSRALAFAIDALLVGVVFVVSAIVVAIASADLDEAASAAVAVALFLLVPVGVPVAVETLSHGRSPGKAACGLRVVRDDGGPIRFRHALVRGAMGLVEILMTVGVVACVASLVSARGRRLGDVFAGTLVVRERVTAAGRSLEVPPPPPWLLGRFTQLDLSAVPDALWLAVRQYLTRMRQLDPGVAGPMADRLARDLAARTGVPVPPGVPAGAYLAAVVQERQTRDIGRIRASGPARTGQPPWPAAVEGPSVWPAGAGQPGTGTVGGIAAPPPRGASGRDGAPPESAEGTGPGVGHADVEASGPRLSADPHLTAPRETATPPPRTGFAPPA
ncbi:RDD family protein [uncultured Streptomyces sp.]|uniref:RDD family protein n=1 Tax=uncultured Streptomyces sp. TaxID=174707 RepID=UPI002621715E|nr:RDD family protein [uncultured Streptomyces sp.]